MALPGQDQPSFWRNLFLGSPARTEQFSKFTPEIQAGLESDILKYLTGQGKSPMEEQTLRQFESNVVPSLAQRFLPQGVRDSSAFRGEFARGKGELAQNLQSQRFQALMNLLPQAGKETAYFPAQPGLVQQAIPAAVEVGKAFISPEINLMSLLGSLFKGSSTGAAPEMAPSAPQALSQSAPAMTAAPLQTSSTEGLLQKIIDQLMNKPSVAGAASEQAPDFLRQTNPAAFRLGGSSIAQNYPDAGMALLKKVLAQNRPGGLSLNSPMQSF